MDIINLEKGQKVTLDKRAPGVTKFSVGLGWDKNPTAEIDLDASAFCCVYDGAGAPRLDNPDGFVYFRHLQSACGGVTHSGDNTTGDGDGDDETISLDFSKIDRKYKQVDIFINIYDADGRRQNFGMVKNPHATLYDDSGNKIATFDLTDDDVSVGTCLHFVSFFIENDVWKFQAIGTVTKNDLKGLIGLYGPQFQTT